jgi:hypothetical protein
MHVEGYSFLLYLLIAPPVLLLIGAVRTLHAQVRDPDQLTTRRRTVYYQDRRGRSGRYRLTVWCTTNRPSPCGHLRPLHWIDRLLKLLHFGPVEPFAENGFDRRWSLDWEHPALAEMFRQNAALCVQINRLADELKLLNVRVREISFHRHRVQVSLSCAVPGPGTSNADLAQMCAEPLVTLSQTLESGALSHGESRPGLRAGLSLGVRWFHWVLVGIGYYGLLRSYQGPFLFEPMRLFLDTLWFSIPIGGGLLLCLLLTHARSSRLGSLLRHGLLVGLPGVVLTSHCIARELNLHLDETRWETVHYPVLYDGQPAVASKGHFAWIELAEPLTAGSPVRRLKLSPQAARSMGLGWPPRGTSICVSLRWSEGALGYPWTRSIRVIPNHQTFIRDTPHPCTALTIPDQD